MEDTPAGRSFSEAFDIVRSVRHGWRSMVRCLPILFVGGCLKACTDGAGGGGGGAGGNDEEWERAYEGFFGGAFAPSELGSRFGGVLEPMLQSTPDEILRLSEEAGVGLGLLVAVVAMVVLVVTLLILAFRAWLVPGYIRVHREILETGQGEWVTLFSGADCFVRMFLWQLLKAVVVLGTVVVVSLPGGGLLAYAFLNEDGVMMAVGAGLLFLLVLPGLIYVTLGVSLGDHAVVLDQLAPVDALARSWSLVDGNRLWLLFYDVVTFLVLVLVALPGLCLCLVGVYLTRALGFAVRDVGRTESYLLLTQPAEATQRWSIWSWGE